MAQEETPLISIEVRSDRFPHNMGCFFVGIYLGRVVGPLQGAWPDVWHNPPQGRRPEESKTREAGDHSQASCANTSHLKGTPLV